MSGIDLAALAWNLAAAALAVAVVMLITLAIATRLRIYAVVDIAWGVGFVVVAALTFAVGTARR